MLDRTHPALRAVAHKPGRLIGPLVIEEVERTLQGTWNGMVVFGGYEDEGVEVRDCASPFTSVRVAVVLRPCRGNGLVEVWEVEVCKIDDLELCVDSRSCQRPHPICHIGGS